jgi:leader peptidase (prepilin peptidase)/N-methyltransferase
MGIIAAAGSTAVIAWSVALSVIDVRHRRLPNTLTLTGATVILAAAGLAGRGAPAALGAATLGGLYLLVHLCSPAGMGGGDVKLALGTGALTGALGADVWVLAALGAPLLTAVVGTVWALCRGGVRCRRGRSVPHGPSMCAATLAAAGLAVL